MLNQRRLSQNQFIGLKRDLMLKFHEGAQYLCVDIGAEELYVYNANEDPILIASTGDFSLPVRAFAADTNVSPAIVGNPTELEINNWNQSLPVPFKDTVIYYTGNDTGVDETILSFHSDGNETITKLSSLSNDASLSKSYIPSTEYLENEIIYQVSPTTGHPTLYRRIADGTSGLVFDASEELLWLQMSSLGINRLFLGDTGLSPAVALTPSVAEVEAYISSISIRDAVLYYTGTDIASDKTTYSFDVDASGKVTPMFSPSEVKIEDVVYGGLNEYDSMALALTDLGPNKPFRWSQINIDGVPSPNGSQHGITK